MAFEAIPFDQQVNPGDKLKFHFSFFSLLYVTGPSEGDLLESANKAPGFSVSEARYDTFASGLISESGTVTGVVTETITPSEIAEGIKQSFSQDFKIVKGISIDEVDKEKFELSFKPSIPTTITFVAVAIIGLILFIQFGSVSRRLTT